MVNRNGIRKGATQQIAINPSGDVTSLLLLAGVGLGLYIWLAPDPFGLLSNFKFFDDNANFFANGPPLFPTLPDLLSPKLAGVNVVRNGSGQWYGGSR
jgi:hypothetical protein